MAANALEVRMAHLEGAYEQIDTRLGSLERQVADGFLQLRTDVRWVIGLIVINWITVILAIFSKH